MTSNYDKHPYFDSGLSSNECASCWNEVTSRLTLQQTAGRYILCIECYPGAFEDEIEREIVSRLKPAIVIRASEAYRSPAALQALFARDLTTDPVFGRMSGAVIADFFDEALFQSHQALIAQSEGVILVIGTGATLLAPNRDCFIYADMARWELQLRQRKNLIGNLGLGNLSDRAGDKYKRAFFLDWRAADRLKLQLLPRADWVLDTNSPDQPAMISGITFRATLARAVHSPLRLVPFFDPGPWGGQWMKEKFDLPPEAPNYAWCFDCVPEENSLILSFGDRRFQLPAIDLVFFQPDALMGPAVHARFGLDFPIRFDLLDTMGGGNLSFQVHPLTEYIQSNFGMAYTQDESYYLLDAGDDAVVYLGLRPNIDPIQMASDLAHAQDTGTSFPVDQYANRIEAKKHDHFLIPAGTPHCSGANSMVLEISATPYIFTFKLFDWERLGLDGRPRPVHLDHGLKNIQWDRDEAYVHCELVNVIEPITSGPGWQEERTGLHEREFIETRRHWFTEPAEHDTWGNVNVLNLVEGSEAVVESPSNAFQPFTVHYAETFIIPAAVGRYTIRPVHPNERCATLKAFVRIGVSSQR
ncbi:class I mannose-6-phosphate isomerase [Granulicella arctica]|uniref:class I mannose-6-phosphate isomerase n=1 Tax=Granulicella arctica TaxID=940613 RepID=UPI0021E0F941|nr:class I mannose-6-phosphate isomerase [Granulicella arctica]